MYFIRRCWFLKCSEEGLLVGVVLLVPSEIYYVPIGDGWEEVLVRNVLITYQYFTLDTNIKFASTGDRTRVACVTGGHWALYVKSYQDNIYQCCGSGMFIPNPGSPIPDPTFFHPGSRIWPVSVSDPGSASKNLSILTPKKTKKWFLSSRKYDPSCSSWIPDPDADFLPIPDPGSRGQKGTGSRIPANHPPPPEYLLTQYSCKETSPPLLHTTTHNSTQIHTTTNVPVVFMARYVMILRGATSLLGTLKGVGCTPQNYYVPRHKNNRYINSYNCYCTLKVAPASEDRSFCLLYTSGCLL